MKKIIKADAKREVLSLITNIAFADVPTWYGATRRNLHMNVIRPKVVEGHKKLPLIVWICGGAYRMVDNAVWLPEMMYFARKGYIVAGIEYRTVTEAGFPAQLIDVKSAIRYLKAHADLYCIDKEHVYVMGESAGGTMASLAGVTGGCQEFDQGDYLEETSQVNAVVDFYGIVDTQAVQALYTGNRDLPAWVMEDFIGPNFTPEQAQKASAIHYVNDQTPPFFILHGTADEAVNIEQSEMMYRVLKEHNVEAEFFVLEGAGHGADAFYQDEILEEVEAFLRDK